MSDFRSAFNKKLCQRTFRRTPHFLIPGLNQQRTSCNEHSGEHVSQFPLHCVEHKLFMPKLEVPRLVNQGHDTATYLVGEKLRWKERANILAKRYRKNAKERTTLELLHGKLLAGATDVRVSQPLARFLKHLAGDQDQDFCGAYNWYYCDGTLSVVNLKRMPFVICAQGKYLDKLCLIPLEENSGNWEACHSSAITKSGPIQRRPIYQISGREVRGRAVVGVRQRNAIAIYLNNVRRLSLNLVCVHTSELNVNEKPFTGLNLDPSKPGHFCNSHSDRTVKLWDPAYRDPVLKGIATRNMNCSVRDLNSWCGVWYDNDDINQIIVADRCCVTWHDLRCGLTKTKGICLTSSKQGLPLEMSCEEVSLVLPSKRHHQLYLGTSHSLLQIDKRKPVVAPQPVRRWTHMLDGQLLMGRTVPLPGTKTELICVSCTQRAVMVIGGEICCSQHQPLALPCPSTKQSLVGLSFLPDPHVRRYDLITQIGDGDMYKHNLNWEETNVGMLSTQDIKYGTEYSDYSWPVGEGRQLQITRRCDMQPVYLGLQNASGSSVCQRDYIPPIQRQPWENSKAQLSSYIDVLAPIILDVWGVDEMQEWSTTAAMPSAVDKVEQWLQMNSTSPTCINQDRNQNNYVTAAARISQSIANSIEQVPMTEDIFPASQFDVADSENNISMTQYLTPLNVHASKEEQAVSKLLNQGQSEKQETVILACNSSANCPSVSGDSPFQSHFDALTPSKNLKIVKSKRKSQILGF